MSILLETPTPDVTRASLFSKGSPQSRKPLCCVRQEIHSIPRYHINHQNIVTTPQGDVLPTTHCVVLQHYNTTFIWQLNISHSDCIFRFHSQNEMKFYTTLFITLLNRLFRQSESFFDLVIVLLLCLNTVSASEMCSNMRSRTDWLFLWHEVVMTSTPQCSRTAAHRSHWLDLILTENSAPCCWTLKSGLKKQTKQPPWCQVIMYLINLCAKIHYHLQHKYAKTTFIYREVQAAMNHLLVQSWLEKGCSCSSVSSAHSQGTHHCSHQRLFSIRVTCLFTEYYLIHYFNSFNNLSNHIPDLFMWRNKYFVINASAFTFGSCLC